MSKFRKIRHYLPLALVFLVACATTSRVENPAPSLEADRPDFTESPETVPPGSIQAEAGYTFSSAEGSTSHAIGELLIRIPAGNRAEARLGFNSYAIEHPSGSVLRGFEDIEIGAKIKLVEREERSAVPNVSVLLLFTLPTGHRGIGSSVVQPGGKLALGWQLTDRLSVESNANYFYASESGTHFSQWSGSASLGLEMTPRLGSFVEWFGTNPVALGAGRADYVNVGAGMGFGSALKLDARVGTNTRSIRDYFIGFGVSRRW
jgi:hypothetical protein